MAGNNQGMTKIAEGISEPEISNNLRGIKGVGRNDSTKKRS